MRTLAATAALALMATPLGAQDENKIGRLPAAAALQRALATTAKAKSAAISEASLLQIGQQRVEAQFDGILKRDFAGVKGTQEVYAKAATYLVNLGGRFDPPERIESEEGVAASNFKNPALLLRELAGALRGARFGGDEEVGGEKCRIVDVPCDARMVRQHLKEISERLNLILENRARNNPDAGGFGLARLIGTRDFMDPKTSLSYFKVWVGVGDLLVRRIEWVCTPKMRPNALGGRIAELEIGVKIDVTFSKWDEEVDFDVPLLIRRKFGVR